MESWVQFDFFLQTNFKHCTDDADLVFKIAQWYFTQLTVTLPNCSNVLEECESHF